MALIENGFLSLYCIPPSHANGDARQLRTMLYKVKSYFSQNRLGLLPANCKLAFWGQICRQFEIMKADYSIQWMLTRKLGLRSLISLPSIYFFNRFTFELFICFCFLCCAPVYECARTHTHTSLLPPSFCPGRSGSCQFVFTGLRKDQQAPPSLCSVLGPLGTEELGAGEVVMSKQPWCRTWKLYCFQRRI